MTAAPPPRPRGRVLAFGCAVLVALGATVSSAFGGVQSAATGDALATPAPAVLPVGDVRSGMRGVGYTVVRGTEPQEFRVEVLGVLHDYLPKQDVIVARLTGLDLEETGVVAGMSGSPVYIDDRLVGAVAYQIGDFNREAIAGIIPMDSMLRIAALHDAAEPRLVSSRSAVAGTSPRELLTAAASLLAGSSASELSLPGPGSGGDAAGIRPISVPLGLGGVDPRVAERLSPLFRGLGWQSVSGGTTGSRRIGGELRPGSAIGVQLVRGDINIAATGTVTYVDGDRLLAFGHEYLRGGSVDFPMVRGEVITVINRMQASWKLTAVGEEVIGAIRQDRFAGILGVLGAEPRMVPVELSVDGGSGNDREFSFELVADKSLSPLFLFFGVANALQSLANAFGDSTLEVVAQFSLHDGLPTLRVNNVFSSNNQAFFALSQTIAGIYSFLYDNAFEPVEVEGIDLEVAVRDDRKVARISRVEYDRTEVRPGDTVGIEVWLKPYREAEVSETIELRLPDDLAPGPLEVVVGDAGTMAREEQSFLQGGEVTPRDLEHLVRLLNGMRRNDHLYVQASRPGEGAYFKGQVLPSLPPSKLAVLSARQSSGDFIKLDKALILEHQRAVPYVVSGQHRIELSVRRR